MGLKKHTISEVATLLDYEAHVLRFYEREFNIAVPRNKNNRRQYTTKEIETFQYIKTLKEQGYNNNQIKQILKSPTVEEEDTSSNAETTDIQLSSSNKKEFDISEMAVHLEHLSEAVFYNFNEINQNMKKLNLNLEELRSEHFMEEKSVLESENEKLKMRLKEKTYELVDIKEKYSRLEQKKFVFKKIFK
ncbi:helix-turn-helix domain-containing protein [Alkalibaculum sporogenes]|uniref:helix-turn-helix domain-containing protein n=1 Tax=Alkalibaculum sporogenes TaxID=2655001 RepID=UPI00128D251F|nr:helix-turn-helix domain-containing protein [Alkalibaculum sporogenes]